MNFAWKCTRFGRWRGRPEKFNDCGCIMVRHCTLDLKLAHGNPCQRLASRQSSATGHQTGGPDRRYCGATPSKIADVELRSYVQCAHADYIRNH